MAEASPFSPRVVAAVVLAAALAFLGFLFLSAYGPQIKLHGPGGIHPMSKAATGFFALYHLAETTGRPVNLITQEREWGYTGFEAVTLDVDTDPVRLRTLVGSRRTVDNSKTLYIFPKWIAMPLPTHTGWVQTFGTLQPEFSQSIIDVFGRIRFGEGATTVGSRIHGLVEGDTAKFDGQRFASVDVPQPERPHFIVSGMKPVLVDDNGRTVLGRNDFPNGASDYILADPDILSNRGLKTAQGARAALTIIDAMRADANDSVAFDLVLNGHAGERNLLQLMFEPPFLALTLAVLAAALLVGIHAFGRFGPPLAEPRAIPFGKRALADNAAILIARAGAAKRMGDRYVALTRDAVAAKLGAAHMDSDALERWLGSLSTRGNGFAVLAAEARSARDGEAMRASAQALHSWRDEVTRDR